MIAVDEILLQRSQIDSAVAKLTGLAESIDSKKLSVDFGKSSGAFTDATIQYADELKNLGSALASLYYNTATALNRIAEEFYGTDESVANTIGNGNPCNPNSVICKGVEQAIRNAGTVSASGGSGAFGGGGGGSR